MVTRKIQVLPPPPHYIIKISRNIVHCNWAFNIGNRCYYYNTSRVFLLCPDEETMIPRNILMTENQE